MNIDFSLLLLVLSGVTGALWLLDRFVFSRPRTRQLEAFLKSNRLEPEEFRNYLASLDENGRPMDSADTRDPAKHTLLAKAWELYREPVVIEYAKSFFPILFAVLLLRSFLYEPFQIPTGSMIPTLNVGDFIVVNKYAYGVRLPVTGTKVINIGEPKRGDIMVFIPPHDPNYFIKRVIGMPGDHVRYSDKIIYINGEALLQDNPVLLEEQGIIHSQEAIGGVTHDIYTAASQRFNRAYEWMPAEGIIIPQGHYFMMGDNRDNSSDSRTWGPVSEDKIVGKAVAVWMHKEPGLALPTFSQNRLIVNPD
jgi:signal peptidase I